MESGERMSEAMLMQTGGQILGASLSSADPRAQAAATLIAAPNKVAPMRRKRMRARDSSLTALMLLLHFICRVA